MKIERARKAALLALLFILCLGASFILFSHARAAERFLDIQKVQSAGGIPAWLVEDHSLPVITIEFAFAGAGSALDPADRQGLARMLSNTLDEGAGEMDSQAFQKALDDNVITLSFTSARDDLHGTLKTLTRHKDTAFGLLQMALTAPRFDQEAIERMRAANITRIRSSLSDPGWLAARLINDTAFAGHPYALNSGGTLTSLQKITAADLRTFAAEHMSRDQLLVSAVGDITPAELTVLLDKVFGKLPAKSKAIDIPDSEVKNGGQIAFFEKDIPQTVIEIMQPGIGRGTPDYHAFQIMNFILGGSGFGSRLTEEVREKRGLTYGVHSAPFLLDHLKALSISTSTESGNTIEVLGLIKQEIEKMKSTPVTDKELADAKSYLIGSLPLNLTSTDDIAGIMMGLQLDHLPIDYLDTLKQKIEAVTKEDIQRVAQKILKPDGLTIAVVGKKQDGLNPTRIVDRLPNVE